jgi:hypothetical protein
MNLGRVDNRGFEAQATLQALTRRNFSWEVTGNIGTNHDEIKNLGGVPSIITTNGPANVVGYPVQGLWSRVVFSLLAKGTDGADGLSLSSE